MVTICWI